MSIYNMKFAPEHLAQWLMYNPPALRAGFKSPSPDFKKKNLQHETVMKFTKVNMQLKKNSNVALNN